MMTCCHDLERVQRKPWRPQVRTRFSRAERLLGRNGIAEVLALLGYYGSVAMP
jgi:hypothetical protein